MSRQPRLSLADHEGAARAPRGPRTVPIVPNTMIIAMLTNEARRYHGGLGDRGDRTDGVPPPGPAGVAAQPLPRRPRRGRARFQLAERLGSVNAAAVELGTTWPSPRKVFTRHGLGMPASNPEAVGSGRSRPPTSAAAGRPRRALTRCLWPSTTASSRSGRGRAGNTGPPGRRKLGESTEGSAPEVRLRPADRRRANRARRPSLARGPSGAQAASRPWHLVRSRPGDRRRRRRSAAGPVACQSAPAGR
jgi:hypothetical protein